MQTPTTETGIYANWDVDVSGDTTNDDPWDFGTASQYPVLDYGSHVLTKQRNTVTITATPIAIWERFDSGLSRGNTSIITATLTHAWEDDVTVTLPAPPATDPAYSLNTTTIAIAAGQTTGTSTLTAVDDTVDQTSPDSRSVSLSATTIDSDVIAVTVTNATITISDDDNVAAATGVKLATHGKKIKVDWTAGAGATGYKVQWTTTNDTAGWGSLTGSKTISSGSTVTHTISSGLSANTVYFVRVISTKTGEIDAPPSTVVSATTRSAAGTGDYDLDNDGLIEITTLAQLNAMRWDLDGDGVPVSGKESDYSGATGAFPNAEANMGCNESDVTIQSGTGNPKCTGYELRASLDFDTGTKGTRTDDTYYDGGKGWDPIGSGATAYTATFDGNSDTDSTGDGGPYTIANLFIDRDATTTDTKYYAGLFRADRRGRERQERRTHRRFRNP